MNNVELLKRKADELEKHNERLRDYDNNPDLYIAIGMTRESIVKDYEVALSFVKLDSQFVELEAKVEGMKESLFYINSLVSELEKGFKSHRFSPTQVVAKLQNVKANIECTLEVSNA